MRMTHTFFESPIGRLTLVARDGVLSGVYFPAHAHQPDPATFGELTHTGFNEVTRQLDEYFRAERTEFEVEIAPRGSEFQLRVWKLLRQIPYGETRTYGQLARELGNVSLAREVGGANARNPLSVVVPCHRVVGANGKLVGYAGGIERKQYLLDLEARVAGQQLSIG